MRRIGENTRLGCWQLCRAGWVALFFGLVGSGSLHAETAGVTGAAEAPSASATPRDSSLGAGQWMREGASLFARGQWEASRQAFLRAWELRKHHAVAANLAEVEIKLGLWREAAEHLRFALQHLPAGRTDDRTVAETQLEECRQYLASVAVTASREGATVSVDGQPMGRLPLAEPLLLEPGRHTLSVELTGHGAERAELDVTAGQKTSVEFELRPLASPRPNPPPAVATSPRPTPPRLPDSSSSPRVWLLVGGGALTLAAAGLGVGYSLRSDAAHREALRDSRAVDDRAKTTDTSGACVAPPELWAAQCAALKSDLGESTNARRVAHVSFIAAGALGVATVTTFFLLPSRRESPRGASLHPAIGLGPGLGAVNLYGAF
jgi:hypothetical protein